MKNSLFKKLVRPNNKNISVIVEMSGNHQGSFKGAKKFINSAIRSGADIVKFQVYTPDTITINSSKNDFLVKSKGKWGKYKNLYSLYKKAHTPWSWIERLSKICNKNKVAWFASPFDTSAVDFLEKLNCPAYKIASPEVTDIELIAKVAKTNKPIILSTGLANEDDLNLAVKTIKKNHNKFAILKCTSAYPSPIEDLNLSAINLIKNKYKCAVGFSDHTIGTDASKVAVALGATLIEKHFKIDKDKKSIDTHFSLSLKNLKNFKKELENVALCIGKKTLKITPSVKPNLSGKRSLYVVKDVSNGDFFTSENIRSIRPSYGMHPKYLRSVLGKKAKKNIKAGKKLSQSLISRFTII